MIEEIASILRNAESITILSHVSPDGDTLGSAAALKIVLEKMGKSITWFCDGSIPNNCRIIPDINDVKMPEAGYKADVCVSVDISDLKRCGSALEIYNNARIRINIDHHISNGLFGQYNLIRNSAATGEIILELINKLGVGLDEPIARALYIAISTDTGALCYSNTTADTLRSVAKLIESGIDVADITDNLFRKRTLVKTLLIARALNNLHIHQDISYIRLSNSDFLQTGASNSDCDGLVDYAREIEGIEVAFLARETENNAIKISLRSNGKIDVCNVASKFDGGGHRQAAGCTINSDIDSAIEMIVKSIGESTN